MKLKIRINRRERRDFKNGSLVGVAFLCKKCSKLEPYSYKFSIRIKSKGEKYETR
jgi:hypothetical protein